MSHWTVESYQAFRILNGFKALLVAGLLVWMPVALENNFQALAIVEVEQEPSPPLPPPPKAKSPSSSVQRNPASTAKQLSSPQNSVSVLSPAKPELPQKSQVTPKTTSVLSENKPSNVSPATETQNQPQNLEQLYQDNRQRSPYTSVGYLWRVFGTLSLLLGALYFLIRFLLPRLHSPSGDYPLGKDELDLTPRAKTDSSTLSIWKSLFAARTTDQNPVPKVKVLSRTRISPSKEILIVQIADRQLVIGTTPQQMSLLTELPVPEPNLPMAKATRPSLEKTVHKKYLTPKSSVPPMVEPPAQKEVYVLRDYEEQFEGT